MIIVRSNPDRSQFLEFLKIRELFFLFVNHLQSIGCDGFTFFNNGDELISISFLLDKFFVCTKRLLHFTRE